MKAESRVSGSIVPASESVTYDTQIVLDYYYSPGCRSCLAFLKNEIPALEKTLNIKLEIKKNIRDAVTDLISGTTERRGSTPKRTGSSAESSSSVMSGPSIERTAAIPVFAAVFAVIANAIRWILVVVLVIFAFLSLYDFYLIKIGKAKEMVL
ncbi:MAG: hypothetical protein GXP33_02590 [Spirochaetes bacterium]|nr:hypothetical protein [Spirochaetota bacterium]